jgi:ribosome-associated protein
MKTENIIKELHFKATRSGGAGGQHVNKVSSKIVLFFDISKSIDLSEDEKEILIINLNTKLTKDKILILRCDESRSQHKNKEIVTDRFLQIIISGLKVQKLRKATKPSKTSIEKRLVTKKKQGLKKFIRKKPNFD